MADGKTPAAQPDDWERALRGVDFPAAKVAVIRNVREIGGIDHEVLTMLDRLPQNEYETLEDMLADVRALYVADGVPQNSLPV